MFETSTTVVYIVTVPVTVSRIFNWYCMSLLLRRLAGRQTDHSPNPVLWPPVRAESWAHGQEVPMAGSGRQRAPSFARARSALWRNLCPSCQTRRSVLFAEWLHTEVLGEVSHRHVVFTVPNVLRGLFERERSLLGLLAVE